MDAIRKAGHTRLFPHLTRGANGYSDPIGKWWGRHVTKCGILDDAAVLHSLRHGGITRLHSSGCPADIAEMLVGHAAGNVHAQYVHRGLIKMSTLRDGLEKLRYEGVVKELQEALEEIQLPCL